LPNPPVPIASLPPVVKGGLKQIMESVVNLQHALEKQKKSEKSVFLISNWFKVIAEENKKLEDEEEEEEEGEEEEEDGEGEIDEEQEKKGLGEEDQGELEEMAKEVRIYCIFVQRMQASEHAPLGEEDGSSDEEFEDEEEIDDDDFTSIVDDIDELIFFVNVIKGSQFFFYAC
jgi:hypothetical protein